MEILVIEDNPVIGKAVHRGICEAGHECAWVQDSRAGFEQAMTQRFDVIVLDLMIPGEHGMVLLENLRKQGVQTPVLVLSALGSVDDRVKGLKAGADDYLVKPFALAELMARIGAICRRAAAKPPAVIQVGDLTLYLATRWVTKGDVRIELTPTEFSILELLMRHAGQVVTRKMLYENLWGSDWEASNAIDVHINRLRGKLQRDSTEPLIQTARGRGYILRG
jgi:two-component system OmpR family response regulator/two-component system copper resistance phosphate regulon response regulator CusR